MTPTESGAAKGSTPTGPPPTIAVIVLAHQRERYIEAAIRSVLDQTAPRAHYEILVTKAFHSDSMDRWLESEGIPSIFESEPRYGRKLAHAVDSIRAPFVTILEDDDLFERERIAGMLEVFSAHPDLGYYHNRPSGMTPEGAPLPMEFWQPQEIDAQLDRTGPEWFAADQKASHSTELLRGASWFNVSSIAVRRELLQRAPRRFYDEVVMTSMDAFLIGLAWASPYGMFLDDRRLTRYRHHQPDFAMNLQTGRRGIVDVQAIVDLMKEARSVQGLAWVNAMIEESWKWLFFNDLKQSMRVGAPRGTVIRKAAAYARFLVGHPQWLREKGAWQTEVDAGAYLFTPHRIRRKLSLTVSSP